MTENFGDARLEELKLLSELARVPSHNEPPLPGRTARRDMIAHLIDAGYANYLTEVALTSATSKATSGIRGESDVERRAERHRSETLYDLFSNQEVRLTISHRGRVRLSELKQQLQSGLIRDPMGILIDGRHLDTGLQVARYDASQERPLSIAFSDINGMKHINDTYSHAAGDMVIRAYFTAIMTAISGSGEAYRYGGDEVVTLLPGAGATKAVKVLSDACRLAADENLHYHGQELPRLRLSIGIISVTDAAMPPPELLARADKQMYRAKDSKKREPNASAIAVESEAEPLFIPTPQR